MNKEVIRQWIDQAFVDYIINKRHESYTFGRLSGMLLIAYSAECITPNEWDFIDRAASTLLKVV